MVRVGTFELEGRGLRGGVAEARGKTGKRAVEGGGAAEAAAAAGSGEVGMDESELGVKGLRTEGGEGGANTGGQALG